MTTPKIKGDWNITEDKLKQKWARLTDKDLRFVPGHPDELLGLLQKSMAEARKTVRARN